ncbi:MAG: hypothetical protein ACLQNE_15005 [Thermoguttaceae bacterium]|jgi:hypothetical protein
MPETLALRIARQRVEGYEAAKKYIIEEHNEAMDCLDCEAFVQMGIDAFRWLIRADETIRRAIAAGRLSFDADVDAALRRLFVDWLRPCEVAEKWASRQHQRGNPVENYEELRKCREEAAAIVASFAEEANAILPEPMGRLQDEALADYQVWKR